MYNNYPNHPIRCGNKINIKDSNLKINVILEWSPTFKKYVMYTDDLKYGDKLEIVFDKIKNIYSIKNLEKIKEKWNKKHGISNNPLEIFLELEDGMSNLQK